LSFLLSNNNFFNYYVGQILTVTIQFAITFTTFLVEDKDFVAAALVIEHFANHFSALNVGSAHFYFTLVVQQQHVLKLNGCAFLELVHTIDEQFLASLYSKLLAFHFYNCVHLYNTVFNVTAVRRALSKRDFYEPFRIIIQPFHAKKPAKVLLFFDMTKFFCTFL